MKNKILSTLSILSLSIAITFGEQQTDNNSLHAVGQAIDEYNGVSVYYNGNISHVLGRNTTPDGYNLGLKYQCVEFVKRYYYQYLNHKMPDSYGHAKDFFDKKLANGAMNTRRNLTQYRNASSNKPQVNDLMVFDGHLGNPYGHVAIISAVNNDNIEIIQQNVGKHTRAKYPLNQSDGIWTVQHNRLLGWLRKE